MTLATVLEMIVPKCSDSTARYDIATNSIVTSRKGTEDWMVGGSGGGGWWWLGV